MENLDGVIKVIQDMINSEEDKEKSDLSPSLESQQQWQISGDLEEFLTYIKLNPVHCPMHANYSYKLYKYYRGELQ